MGKQSLYGRNRRSFLKKSCLGTAGLLFVPAHVLGRGGAVAPSDKLDIAAIGVGGRGARNLEKLSGENIVALCDVDDISAAESYRTYSNARKYRDFRRMLDREKNIDAVVVSTPDHTHTIAAMMALDQGKHVYVEKPLAHNVFEIRKLMAAARKAQVQTQVGNQGHSFDEIREVCEWIWDGAIGDVTEVHAWFTRIYGNGSGRPADRPKVPVTLDWDLWLGPAPYRPYHPAYVSSWRTWADFGTGILGDWVCHLLDPAFWALRLKAPEKIVANNGSEEYSPERFPSQSTVEWKFDSREGMPPVRVTLSYGKPFSLPQLEGVEISDWNREAGAIFVGEKGCIVHGSHGGQSAQITPEARRQEYRKPVPTLPRIDGDHQLDWVRACKDGRPASSEFSYGGPLSELGLLGVIATVFNREELLWDAKNARFTNHEKANELIEKEYRQGWKFG